MHIVGNLFTLINNELSNFHKKKMETYRIINRELSINNQELRNAVNKLKYEVTYLNHQLFEQREQFIRLKESIASAIEKQYHMTLALIFPEKVQQKKSPNRMDFMCHRRSCSNITAASSLKNVIHSPPIKSPSNDSEVNVCLKTTLPKIVVQRDSRISRSPRKTRSLSPNQSENTAAVEMSTDSPEDRDYHDSLATGETSPNNSLLTINEEQSSGTDTRNETLTDATINSLLDAPCSTPYNNNKVASDVNQGTKDMRVLVQKLNIEQIMQISKNIFKSRTSKLNVSTDNLTQYNISKELQKDGSRNDAMNDITETKLQENQNVQKISKSVKRSKKTFKENIDSESESNYSGDESNVTNVNGKSLRPKRKGISFREPNLRKKLRNTTNMKL